MELYIANLPYDLTDAGLRDAFAPFGQILSATVITDRETGRSRGFGFVKFVSDDDARTAMRTMDGQPVGDRPLRVSEARQRGDRPPPRSGNRPPRPGDRPPPRSGQRPPPRTGDRRPPRSGDRPAPRAGGAAGAGNDDRESRPERRKRVERFSGPGRRGKKKRGGGQFRDGARERTLEPVSRPKHQPRYDWDDDDDLGPDIDFFRGPDPEDGIDEDED